MKNLILQVYYTGHSKVIADGGYQEFNDLAEESERRIRVYAKSIGADYMILKEPYFKDIKNPGWNRFAMFWLAEKYDNVCYVDADVLPSKEALGVNIFDFKGHGKYMEQEVKIAGQEDKKTWMINAGVIKFTKQECIKLQRTINDKPWLRILEQTGKNQIAFNKCFKKTFRKAPDSTLSPMWNATRDWHEEDGKVYFKHYIGHQKKGNQFGDMKSHHVYNEDWSDLYG
jgi:hypothetical protein